MGILRGLAGGVQAARDPWADKYYTPTVMAGSGVHVNPESAMGVATLHAGVKVIAETLAAMPLIVYRRRADGGRERAPTHPLYRRLHDQPNSWMTAFEFWEFMIAVTILRGNGYALIREGEAFGSELIPLRPDRVEVLSQESLTDPILAYRYTPSRGGPVIIPRDNMFRIHGLGFDGVTGRGVVDWAAQSLGLSIAQQRHASAFFRNSARPSGGIKAAPGMTKEAIANIKQSLRDHHQGVDRAWNVLLLEDGLDWVQIGVTNQEAQFLEQMRFQQEEIARWLRLPPHKVGILDRATFSNIEQQALEFVTDTLMPWARRIEQAVRRDLIIREDQFYVEFLFDSLLRGTTTERYRAYALAAGGSAPWTTRNEIRLRENLNPLPGLDDILTPANMQSSGRSPSDGQTEDDREERRGNAEHFLRMEFAAMRRLARKHAQDEPRWRAAVSQWYQEHVATLTGDADLRPSDAQDWCDQQCSDILTRGLHATADWLTDRTEALTRLMMKGEYDQD